MRKAVLKCKDGSEDIITTYSVKDFPFEKIDTKRLKCKQRKGLEICQAFGTFDIETTTYQDGIREDGKPKYSAFMYHWQMCVDGFTVTGRYWKEWLEFLDKLVERLEIQKNHKFIIYIHNEGYEFQFMLDFLLDHFGDDFKVFATKSRKPIYLTLANGIEFRCSYKLTNMSLNKATKNEKGVIHVKAAGDLDYKKFRTPETELDDTEYGYCISDIVSLYELIKYRLINDYDNLETIPITSTGYVRRDCRRSCRHNKDYRKKIFNKLSLTANVYTLLKEASRGGDTHANRVLSNRVLYDMDSYDVASSYPYQLLVNKFPMGKFMPYGEVTSRQQLDELLGKYACLFRIVLTNVKLKERYAFPYIPIAKVLHYDRKSSRIDNGRILSTDFLQMTVTDVDYELITKQYEYSNIYISDMHIAKKDFLPDCLLDPIRQYFQDKSNLKIKIKELENRVDQGEEGLEEELADAEYFYAKQKNRLNGIFGMMFQDPVHLEVTFDSRKDENPWSESKAADQKQIEEALEKFMKSRNSFLYYPWGVYTTCYARRHLAKMVDTIGQDLSAYCDTDSDKCKHSDESEKRIQQVNEEIKKICIERKAYADVTGADGKEHRFYMGVYEKENKKPIKKFKTMGAKKYCYEDDKGLHLTVSGVDKKKGAEELGSIENFTKGFIFREAGGIELHYNDHVGIHQITLDHCTFTTASNVAMVDSTYTLGITGEYEGILAEYI